MRPWSSLQGTTIEPGATAEGVVRKVVSTIAHHLARQSERVPSALAPVWALAAAVRAACRFWFDGGSQRVAGNHQHAVGPQPGYQPAEILSTLLAARRDLELPDGHWPSQWEYYEWAESKRRLTRRSGKGPRIPGSQADSKDVWRLRQRGRCREPALRRATVGLEPVPLRVPGGPASGC